MKNNKPIIYSIVTIIIGAILMIVGEGGTPPDKIHLLGLLLLSCAVFALILLLVIRFTIFMMKLRGYIKDE